MTNQERIINGLHVEFCLAPNGGSGHPLLFVHGAWSGSWLFAEYLPYLSAGGWNCFAMNLRGHFANASVEDQTHATLSDYARDVITVAHRLPAPPVLIGYGTGAHIVQLALAKGVSAPGAVLISAKLPDYMSQVIPPAVLRMPRLIPAEPLKSAPDIHPDLLDQLNDRRVNSLEPRAVLVELVSPQSRAMPEHVSVPYLVLNGELDEDISPEQGQTLANFFRGQGAFDLIPGASHLGILVGSEWREAANALHTWLVTHRFNETAG
jgi:pimeloyl-ACP methyl ester carboxylesterase